MNDFFGIPMNYILAVLLVMLAGVMGSVLWVREREPILFNIGLRNIPRRRAQSVLIVLGLMLSTVIFAAALSTGDTVTYSITQDTFEKLGRVDIIVQARSNSRTVSYEDEQIAPVGIVENVDIANLFAEFNGRPEDVDGMLPVIRFPAPTSTFFLNETPVQTEPQMVIMAIDPNRIRGFEQDIITPEGRLFDVSALAPGQAVANESAAAKLDLVVGSTVDIWVGSVPRTVTIVGIVQDRYITGWTREDPEGILVSLNTVPILFDVPASRLAGVSFVAISLGGGVRDTLGRSDRVTQDAIDTLGTSRLQVSAIKADRVESAEEEGAQLAAIFIVLGLFTIAAGMLLIFLILVMLAAERRAEMGMSRAIGMKRRQLIQAFMAEGMAYSLSAALVGALLGVLVSIGMSEAMRYIFRSTDVAITFHVEWRSLVISYALGVVLTYAVVVAAAWNVSRVSIVAAIRDLDEPAAENTGLVSLIAGAIVVVAGVALLVVGRWADEPYLAGAGISTALLGLGFLARGFGQPERPVFTLVSFAVIVLWVLIAGGNVTSITGEGQSGLETFFVGGVLMVAGATFAIIYNADILLGGVRAFGLLFSRTAPAVRTAVAYPLASRFRTGTTIAMLSLVVFALVMISTVNTNFRELFLDPSARGGWDVEVAALPTNAFTVDDDGNRLGPLGEALDRAFYPTQEIESIARVAVSNPRRTEIAELDANGRPRTGGAYQVLGADHVFLEQNTIELQARAEGFATDADVWNALKSDPRYAVIDGGVVPGINYANVTEGRFTLKNLVAGETSFTPIPLVVEDTAANTSLRVIVIGVMKSGPSETYRGLWLNESAVEQAFGVLFARYYVRLAPGIDATGSALAVEGALARYGVSADSIEDQVEEQQSLSTAFFLLIQGFLAIGLGVGLVALAVIALRTVVERRQQIGLMRAIGFTRANVGLAFVLESAFVAFLGIINGIWPALLLSNRLLASEDFQAAGFETFHVPWLQIGLMAGGVFLASVLTTVIPSRQASGIPPAEALRYE